MRAPGPSRTHQQVVTVEGELWPGESAGHGGRASHTGQFASRER